MIRPEDELQVNPENATGKFVQTRVVARLHETEPLALVLERFGASVREGQMFSEFPLFDGFVAHVAYRKLEGVLEICW